MKAEGGRMNKTRMKAEGGRRKGNAPELYFILHPSSFILQGSSFILHPSSFERGEPE